MRNLPPDVAARLAGGVTTFAHAVIARRRDGATFGFTDHDRDLAVDGVPCRARTGIAASAAEAQLGFAPGSLEIAGALADAAITEEDLLAGLWDGAAVASWLVDWSEPAVRLCLGRFTLGEVRREGGAFVAALADEAERHDRVDGRRYLAACDAELGDARCRLALDRADRRHAATLAAAPDPVALTIAAATAFAPGAFRGGRVARAAGESLRIADHQRIGGIDRLTLWSPPATAWQPGEALTLTVGCDKSFATCRDRFGNAANFRGFPHIPGTDALLAVGREGAPGQDGTVHRP